MGPSRWMIRRAVPNGPRVATTVGLLVAVVVAVAAVVDDDDVVVVVDDLIMVDAAEADEVAVVDDVVVFAVGNRCFQPTSCIAEEVLDDATPPEDDDEDVAAAFVPAAAFTFGLIRTVSFGIDLVALFFPSLSAAALVLRCSAPFPSKLLFTLVSVASLILPKARPSTFRCTLFRCVVCLRNCIRVLIVSSG